MHPRPRRPRGAVRSRSRASPPGAGYTLTASKNGQSTTLTSQSYTTAPTTSVGIALPTGTIAVNAALWAGQAVAGATVTVSGGPNSPATYTGTTNASGVASVTVPATTASYPYTVTITKTTGSITGTATATVTSLASGATATVSPPMTPTGTIAVNSATWAGLGAGDAAVTITGGPNVGATYTGTTSSSGVASIVVPITNSASPYTVTVTKNGGTGTATVTSLASGATATVAPVLTPVKTLTLTIQAGGIHQNNKPITLSITGGPNGTAGAAPAYGGAFTTNGIRRRIAISVPAGTGNYTVKAYVTGCSGSTNRSNNAGSSVSAAAGTTIGDDQHDVLDLPARAPMTRLSPSTPERERLHAHRDDGLDDGARVLLRVVRDRHRLVDRARQPRSRSRRCSRPRSGPPSTRSSRTSGRRAIAGDTSLARISTATSTQLTFLSPDRAQPMRLRRIAYQVTGGQLQRAIATSTNTAAPWTIPTLSAWSAPLVRSIVTTGTPVFRYYDASRRRDDGGRERPHGQDP